MTKIILEKMEFYSFIGVFEEEKKIGSQFEVDIEFELKENNKKITDELDKTIDYSKVYDLVKIEMQQKVNLIEYMAQKIIDTIYSNFNDLQKIKVKISKLSPPIKGKMQKVSAEIMNSY